MNAYTNSTAESSVISAGIQRFDNDAVARHLHMLRTLAERSGYQGNLTIAKFEPVKTILHFPAGARMAAAAALAAFGHMVHAVLSFKNDPAANVYAMLALVSANVPDGRKGFENEVVAALGAVIDQDAGEHAKLPLPPDYVLETSPGNFQYFYLYDRALPPAEAKPLAEALISFAGTDPTAKDLSHVFRIGGTLNRPNQKKIDAGRSPEPFLVREVKAWDRSSFTNVDALREAVQSHWPRPVAVDPLPIGRPSRELADILASLPQRVRDRIGQADEADDRSAEIASLVTMLRAAEITAGEAELVIASTSLNGHYKSAKHRADDIARLWGKAFGKKKSAAELFAGVTPPLPANSSGIPMTTGQTKFAEICAPIVATVPVIAAPDGCPQIPETCPSSLRDALNRAIPGMLAAPALYVDALAALLCVHKSTFDEVIKFAVGADINLIHVRSDALWAVSRRALTKLSGFIPNDKTGKPDSQNSDNVRVFLIMMKIELRFNAWLEQIEKREQDGRWTKFDIDVDLGALQDAAAYTEHGFVATDRLWLNAINVEARKNTIDPAREILDKFESEWDGKHRLDQWLNHACGTPHDAYHTAAGLALIGGMVRRIRRPGCKFDESVLFISPQGYLKGELFRALAPNEAWFTDDFIFGTESKELVLSLAGMCLVEASEMASRSTATNERRKATLSRVVDRGRTAYARGVTARPRRNVFVLSTNNSTPLNDPTGGRRYLPVRLERSVNLEWIIANRDQLIGEACVREKAGETFRPPQSVWAAAAEHQEAARERNDAEDQIEAWFGETQFTKDAYVTAADLAMLGQLASWRIGNEDRGRAMRAAGFADKRLTIGGKQQRAWVRGAGTVRYMVGVDQAGLAKVSITIRDGS